MAGRALNVRLRRQYFTKNKNVKVLLIPTLSLRPATFSFLLELEKKKTKHYKESAANPF